MRVVLANPACWRVREEGAEREMSWACFPELIAGGTLSLEGGLSGDSSGASNSSFLSFLSLKHPSPDNSSFATFQNRPSFLRGNDGLSLVELG